jgi:hypothetical protein
VRPPETLGWPPSAEKSSTPVTNRVKRPSGRFRGRAVIQAVNKRWTGIKVPHFRRCVLRAREDNLPGVTVLAVGQVRAEIVLQCLKLGLINHLIPSTPIALTRQAKHA